MQEASESLKESLKKALTAVWLYSQSNALVDELNKVLGAGLKFETQEFDRLSKALDLAQDEVEQTVVFWDFLNKKLKETVGSSQGLKELISWVKLLEGYFKSMGVSTQEIMGIVEKALSKQGGFSKQNPLVDSLRAIQQGTEKYLPSSSAKP